jgi:transposase
LIGDKVSKNKFVNSESGFLEICKWLTSKGVDKATVCMEATGSYGEKCADFLYYKGHEVSIVNPACIKSYARSLLTRHKTDEVDALVIAQYASKNELRFYKPRDPAFKDLRGFYRCQQNLKSQHSQICNYLENTDSLPSEVVKTYKMLLKRLEMELSKIDEAIEDLLIKNENIKEDCNNLQTIPGIGKITAIALIAEVPDFSSFGDARQLAAYAGLTPRQRTSGTSLRGRSKLSKIGSSTLRKALYFPAIVAKSHNPILKNFADRLKKQGKNTMVIIGAIMRKLLHIVFGVIKHKTTFDPMILINIAS